MNVLKRITGYNKHSTLLKYLLSYFILFNILFFGFFTAVRVQLKDIYFKDLRLQAEKRLSNTQEQFLNNLNSLNRIQSKLANNIDLVLSRHKNEDWYLYEAANKLEEYTTGNNFIDSICYLDHLNKTYLSSGKHVRQQETGYGIYTGTHYISFPLDEYKKNMNNQLIYLKDETSQLLIYLPYNNAVTSYTIFYVISNMEVNSILENSMFTSVSAISLLDPNDKIVTGINSEALEPYLSSAEHMPDTLYTIKTLNNGYSIAALLSNQALLAQVNIAFYNTYALLLLIAGISMLLILIAMRVTYWPLHKLTRKYVTAPLPNQGYVEQLDNVFTNVNSENKQLLKKVEYYRQFMQHSILDSIVKEYGETDINTDINMDNFFNIEQDQHIFIIKVQFLHDIDCIKNMKKSIENALPENSSCAVLVKDSRQAIFMLQYAGMEQNKEEVMHLLISELCEEYNCYAALSNSSASALEIPSLYENALSASNYWSQAPVISYLEIANHITSTNDFAYPYSQLDLLSAALKEQDFVNASLRMDELFWLIEKASDKDTPFPDFFIRCVLIDILSIILNHMNRLNIKLKSYNDLYFETLYMCRSCVYSEKKEEILRNVKQLLHTYEQEYNNTAIHTSQIRQMIEDNFTSPDFSITALADKFQVSIAYMSYIFKKKFEENFSDYLWGLRMEKAKNLLCHTDMTIDTISLSVGYLNTSSFRRKFKQETGNTPSQFRNHL